MNFNRREKVLRIIKVIFFTLLFANFINMTVWAFICNFSNPSEDEFKNEAIIVITSLGIVALGALCLFFESLKQKKMSEKFTLYFENKEYSKAAESFKKLTCKAKCW